MIKIEGEKRRWLLFAFAFLSVSLVAGLVYGWPALRQDLRDDGSTLSERELGAIFTAGSWSAQGGRFLTGIARDRFGTRIITCLTILCSAGGCLGIALSDVNNSLALGTSMLFVGLGSGSQLCLQPVASLFPNHTGAVVSSLSGAFQISGLVFLVLTKISNSRRDAFVGLVFFLLVLGLTASLLLPQGSSFVVESEEVVNPNCLAEKEDEQAAAAASPSSEEKEETEPMAMLSSEDDAVIQSSSAGPVEPPGRSLVVESEEDEQAASTSFDEKKETESRTMRSSEDDAVIHSSSADPVEPTSDDEQTANPPLMRQVRSWEYLGLNIWFCVLLVPLQYYVGSIGFQLEARGDDSGFYTDLFSIIYAGAAVLAPGVGYLADRFGLGFAQGLSTSLVAISLFILASRSISLDVHTVGLAAYSTGRMLAFGSFFTNVGKRFGYSNYGTLAGLVLLTSAIASLLQYPLIALASDGHDTVVNATCGMVLVALLPYCIWLARQERSSSRAR